MMTGSNGFDGGNDAGNASLFDAWLQTRLQRLYDEALGEPLPDELLLLLRDFTDRREH